MDTYQTSSTLVTFDGSKDGICRFEEVSEYTDIESDNKKGFLIACVTKEAHVKAL
jgi:hypothetical protein